MKITWCWRCQTDYPMLEDHEWAVLMDAHRIAGDEGRDAAFEFLKQKAKQLGLRAPVEPTEEHPSLARYLWHLVAGFELFTGILEESPNPIFHHYLAHYGPPCTNCDKLLRTRKASYCVGCGEPAAQSFKDNKVIATAASYKHAKKRWWQFWR